MRQTVQAPRCPLGQVEFHPELPRTLGSLQCVEARPRVLLVMHGLWFLLLVHRNHSGPVVCIKDGFESTYM